LALLSPPTDAAPVVPAGASAAFQNAVIDAQRAIEQGDFAMARRLVDALPGPLVTIEWDDSKAPPLRRAEFVAARDEAIAHWKEEMPSLDIRIAKPGRIRLAFADALPPNAESPGPAGAVFFAGYDKRPNVDGMIALTRTAQRLSIDARAVTNEVVYAIGAYLGLGSIPAGGNAMNRNESMYANVHRLAGVELALARGNLRVVQTLQEAVAKRRRLKASVPSAFVEPRRVDHAAAVVQGETVDLSLSITNRGTGPLNLFILPDCGCFRSIRYPRTVAADDIALVSISVDTTDFPGPLDKKLVVLTNDPEQPVRIIPVTMTVEPKFRFLLNRPAGAVPVGDGPTEVEAYLAVSETRPFRVTRARMAGLPGNVLFETWEGEMPDPALGERSRPRKGYRIKVILHEPPPPGRHALTVDLDTTDPTFQLIRHTFFVQRGILASPSNLYLGEIGRSPKRSYVFVSRPNKPFAIKRTSTDSPHFTTSVETTREGTEYRVIVTYDGKADFGALEAMLVIETADPDQPRIEVPISGVVR
jgi:hypothetical protein